MADAATDPPPAVPDSLMARVRADPARAPELIALAAAERHGPAAREWVAEQRGSPADIADRAKRIHARRARVSGGVTGLGGLVTMVPDLLASAWIQSRMVLFIAAAYGFDPTDRMRPAELLVLFELYDDPAQARDALDGAGRTLAAATVHRALNRSDERTLASRLAAMALKRGGRRLAGRAVPGLAALVNAVDNERATRDLADRAVRFYGG